MKEKIGFIGLGLMGSGMATRLIENGYPLIVWNRSYEKLKKFADIAEIARSPKDLFSKSKITIFMLTDGNAVEEVLFKKNGIAGMTQGDIIIDMGTVGPSFSKKISELLQQDGIYYYDAPVLGSIDPAAQGKLQIFLGGNEKKLYKIMPLLKTLGKEVIYLGESGSGSALKLVANMMLTRMVDALGDALNFGKKMGLQYEQVMGLLENSVLSSPMWKRGHILTKQEPPLHFPLKHAVKDLNLIIKEASDFNVSMPAVSSIREDFLQAKIGIGSEEDYSNVVRFKLKFDEIIKKEK